MYIDYYQSKKVSNKPFSNDTNALTAPELVAVCITRLFSSH